MRRLINIIAPRVYHILRDTGGNFAIATALALPVLLTTAGGAVDFTQASFERSRLQGALDAAVLSAVAKPDIASQRREALRFLTDTVPEETDLETALVVAANSDGSLTGTYAQGVPTNFLGLLGIHTIDVKVRSTAIANKNPKPSGACIYVLSNASQAVLINSGANVQSEKCGVEVSSTQNPAFIMNGGATIDTASFCVAGTQYIKNGGTLSNLKPGCKVSGDPYAGSIAEPTVSSTCTTGGTKDGAVQEMAPGVHCGTTFNGSPKITFKPGLHIIKGRMIINSGSTVVAEGVTFYFPDTDSEIRANGNLSFTASAPTSGTYKGILMFEKTSDTANNARKQQYIFNGSNGETLKGVIHLPNRDVTYNSTTNQTNLITLVVNTMIMNSSNWKIEPYTGAAGGAGSEITSVRLVN
ncbi:TadE/TadG family type IV pilus assembly protein [Neorhizobium tomejilense]|uniref:TadE/TadG family type IV pilus assembly protein n=1 Tax=Neorhizobium tomejilense TaxID=2093828 RepID=UPI003ECDF19A